MTSPFLKVGRYQSSSVADSSCGFLKREGMSDVIVLLKSSREDSDTLDHNYILSFNISDQKSAEKTVKIFGKSLTHSTTCFTLEYDIARPY